MGSYTRSGFVEVLAAQQSPENPDWFQGTADAVRQYLWLFKARFRWLGACLGARIACLCVLLRGGSRGSHAFVVARARASALSPRLGLAPP